LEFDNLWVSNPNIGAHRLCARENTYEMPPKKKPENELSIDGPSQLTGALIPQTTMQSQISTVPPQATAGVKRLEEPPQQPRNQAEVLAMNTSAQTTQHPTQLQNIEAQEDLDQDFEEEIKAIIEDELAHLH
jgi:hypothetical protein